MDKIIVTGGAGFLGSYVVEALLEEMPKENIFVPRSKDYDLRNIEDVKKLFLDFPAEIVINCAIAAGNISYNKENPGKVYYENLLMGANLIEIARQNNVKKFVAIGTAIAYPSSAPIPLKESDFWNGYPEETLAPLGLANKMMLVQAQAYRKQYGFNAIYIIPANLYGPRDHFSSNFAHVIPSQIKKFGKAVSENQEKVEAWGTGKASREFLYVKDAAKGIILALKKYSKPEPLNLGSGVEISIKELVSKISELMEFKGEIFWDASKPEGQLRRCMDSTIAFKELGFQPQTSFDTGIAETISWYNSNKDQID